jgi:glycosyltransferase involved in cell wall biosynthesis
MLKYREPISVCMATYNGAKFVQDQISSILSQLEDLDELIISDGLSTDTTLSIISNYNDPRLKIITNPVRLSPIQNFEVAIKAATNEYIFLSDQDDIWLSNKVESTLDAFHVTNADLLVSDCKLVDENLKVINASYRAMYNFKKGKLQSFLLNPYLGCCMAFRRRTLIKILPFPTIIPMHDIWIGIVCEFFYKVDYIEQPLILYRRHTGNATPFTGSKKSNNSLLKKLKFRLNMIQALFVAWTR